MQMEVGIEFLVPGMQRGDKAQFAAEFVFTEAQKRLRGGPVSIGIQI
jgi:hypothetical protein